jgi:DnaK suppressor protein
VTVQRERLERERELVVRRLADVDGDVESMIASSRDTNADDEHDPEGSTIAFERSQLSTVARQARVHLAEVEAAILRLDSGGYGVCERCGQPIGAERLEARPTAVHCIDCAGAT